MKKLLATIVALMLLVNLAACGGKEANVDDGADSNSFSKTETSVSEEQEEMDEIEEQDIQEIAEVANTPKDISEINPDDYREGDFFDIDRFLIDCGCEIDYVSQKEETDSGAIYFYLPDKETLIMAGGNRASASLIGFWYKQQDKPTLMD